ncbi:MAG: hypothetical protein AAF745_18430, partial [Planctomycetota bacterium]
LLLVDAPAYLANVNEEPDAAARRSAEDTDRIIEGLKEEGKKAILVLNKIDAISSPAMLNRVLDRYPNAIPVSAKADKGIGMLIEAVGEALSREFLDLDLQVDPGDGRLLAYLAAKGEIVSQEFHPDVVCIRVKIPVAAMGPVRKSALSITPVGVDHFTPAEISESETAIVAEASEVDVA